MLEKKKNIFFLAIILIIFIGMVYLKNMNNGKHSSNNTVSDPIINVTHISKEEYSDGLDQYSLNPVMNGKDKVITLSGDNSLLYYKLIIKDKGYSDKLPIDVEVFFVTDKNYDLMENSYFTVTEPKNLSSEELNFLNTIVLVEEYGGRANSVHNTLVIDTVYNREAHFDYRYELSFAIDLLELEIIEFTGSRSKYETQEDL